MNASLRLARVFGVGAGLVFVSGCGGSSSPVSAASTARSTPPAGSQASTSARRVRRRPAERSRSATSTAPASAAPVGGATSTPPATNVRVAAVFRILPGDRLQPAFVGVPAFVAIWLEVSSGDGRSHQLVLETPARHDFEVSVGQPAKVLIPGLRAGNYRLLVDGVARGMLITGQAPGP